MFWTPAFAGVTTKETFYELVNFQMFENRKRQNEHDPSDIEAIGVWVWVTRIWVIRICFEFRASDFGFSCHSFVPPPWKR